MKKDDISKTYINPSDEVRSTIYSNSREYYNSLQSINGRFYHLNICDTILPGTGLINTCVRLGEHCIVVINMQIV